MFLSQFNNSGTMPSQRTTAHNATTAAALSDYILFNEDNKQGTQYRYPGCFLFYLCT